MAVKPPLFEEGSVRRWFKILKSQFSLANISTSRTKFNHVLANIPMSVLNKVSESAISSNDYDIIKTALHDLYDKSKPELFDTLMSKTNIMCTKPSVFLNELRKIGT